jgi:hypothetical protein
MTHMAFARLCAALRNANTAKKLARRNDMAYKNCRFCHGQGCLACEGEKEKARQSNPGPTPIFVADPDNEHDMDLLRTFFGRPAIEKAFGNGGGIHEIKLNAAVARLAQELHSESEE